MAWGSVWRLISRMVSTISASRFLRLKISLEVSNFLGAVSGAIPPPKTTRTIDTTVNVPDGATMVVGGIITDNKGKTREAVPFLGDVPILGVTLWSARYADDQLRSLAVQLREVAAIELAKPEGLDLILDVIVGRRMDRLSKLLDQEFEVLIPGPLECLALTHDVGAFSPP